MFFQVGFNLRFASTHIEEASFGVYEPLLESTIKIVSQNDLRAWSDHLSYCEESYSDLSNISKNSLWRENCRFGSLK